MRTDGQQHVLVLPGSDFVQSNPLSMSLIRHSSHPFTVSPTYKQGKPANIEGSIPLCQDITQYRMRSYGPSSALDTLLTRSAIVDPITILLFINRIVLSSQAHWGPFAPLTKAVVS